MSFCFHRGGNRAITAIVTAITAIVVLRKNQPTVGFGFRMMDRHAGLPTNTLSQWLEGDPNSGNLELKPPSDNTFRVIQILGDDKNEYVVVEASDWVALAIDILKKPGKVRKSTKDKLLNFLGWYSRVYEEKNFLEKCAPKLSHISANVH